MIQTRRIIAGMTVTVYHDPVTRQKPEGRALLVQRVASMPDDRLERWRVLFEGNDESEVERIVSDTVTFFPGKRCAS